ncbi:MAG: metallophosphoesterase [Vallitaleaceae bacterium]|jgi:hypothetical protein|nr:metallophosphoesterase [Vallitaleaceae bacterium]
MKKIVKYSILGIIICLFMVGVGVQTNLINKGPFSNDYANEASLSQDSLVAITTDTGTILDDSTSENTGENTSENTEDFTNAETVTEVAGSNEDIIEDGTTDTSDNAETSGITITPENQDIDSPDETMATDSNSDTLLDTDDESTSGNETTVTNIENTQDNSDSIQSSSDNTQDNSDSTQSSSDNTLQSDTEDIPLDEYPLIGITLGSIDAKRIVLTPGENPAYSIGITFNLAMPSDDVTVLVVDSMKKLVGMYNTVESTIQVMVGDTYEPLYVYKTVMEDLSPNKQYYYTLKADNNYSELYKFRTLNVGSVTTLAFFGDPQGYKQSQYDNLAYSYSQAKAIASATGTAIDISYIAGDIVDSGNSAQSWSEWRYFSTAMTQYTSESIFVTAVGNHDLYSDEGVYVNTFNYPENGVPGLSEMNFYYDLPYARVAVWDTEASSTFSDQEAWLDRIMSETDKPFKIVLMHRSVYPMAYNEGYIRNLAEVFEGAGIDLVLNGHDHIYSRTTMYQGEMLPVSVDGIINSDGVTYITGGSSSGSKFYDADEDTDRYWKDFVYDTDHPVFTIIRIGKDDIMIDAYTVINGVAETIDSVRLP